MSADAQHQHEPQETAEEQAGTADLDATDAAGPGHPAPAEGAGRGYTRVDEGRGDLEGGTTGRGHYVDADHGGAGEPDRDLSAPSADEPGGYTLVDEGDGRRAGGTTGRGHYVDAEHEDGRRRNHRHGLDGGTPED